MSSGTVAYTSTSGLPCKIFTFSAKESPGSSKVQHSTFADSGFTNKDPYQLHLTDSLQSVYNVYIGQLSVTLSSAINKASFLSHVFCFLLSTCRYFKYLTMATFP